MRSLFGLKALLFSLSPDTPPPGITAPPEYGGLGLGYTEHCIAMEEVSQSGPRIQSDLPSLTLAGVTDASPFFTSLQFSRTSSSFLRHSVCQMSSLTGVLSPAPPSRPGQPGQRLCRAVIWRPLKPVRQPAGAKRQRGAEEQVPARTHQRRVLAIPDSGG